MKGIVFQVGEPKSIVMFNNGTFDVIDTPPGCREGMVVTVKHTTRLLITIAIIACVFLLGGLIWGGLCRFAGFPSPISVFHNCCSALGINGGITPVH
jgi:hypothetical protein